MLIQTPQGMKEVRRRDYPTDLEFYRAVVFLKFGVVLPSVGSFGEKLALPSKP